MPQVYTVQPLAPERVDQAYPLVHAIEPKLRPAEWRRLYASLRSEGDGQAVLVAVGPNRRLCALCTLRVLAGTDGPPVLALSRLIIGQAIDLASIGRALLRALADRARRSGCPTLRVLTAGSDEQALRALDAARAALDIGLAVELV